VNCFFFQCFSDNFSCNGWSPELSLQEVGKLPTRTHVSYANTLATNANCGQDYMYNALSLESRGNSMVAPRVHSESATHRRTGQKRRATNCDSAHKRWLMFKRVSTTVYSQLTGHWETVKVTAFWLNENCFSNTLDNRTSYSPLHLSQPTCLQAFTSRKLLLLKNMSSVRY